MVAFIIQNENKKIEFRSPIFFEVDSIFISPALRTTLYNKDKEKLKLRSFVIYDSHKIKRGDIIRKSSNSDVLEVLRLDSAGNRYTFLKLRSK